MLAHRWLIVLAHRWLIMFTHRWLITLVHRWPTVNGSQVAHSRLCISSMLRSLQRSFQIVIRGSLGSFLSFKCDIHHHCYILHKGPLFYLL